MSLAFGLAHPHWFQLSGKFNPLSLFSAGEQGIAVPDLTPGNGFLFQDSAGTTPVTAFEQPVGLILDRSKGLVQTTVYTNDGNTASGWVYSGGAGGSIAASGGKLVFTCATTLTALQDRLARYEITGLTTGQNYLVTASLQNISDGVGPRLGIASSALAGDNTGTYVDTNSASLTPVQFIFTASSSTMYLRLIARVGNSNAQIGVDDIRVATLPGNHITQATSTKRPTLRARYNGLLNTDTFSNASWTRINLNLTTGQTAPDGTPTAILFTTPATAATGTWQAASISAVSGNTALVWAKKGSGATDLNVFGLTDSVGAWLIRISINYDTGAVSYINGSSGATVTDAGNGWWQIRLQASPSNNNANVTLYCLSGGSSVAAGLSAYLWQPDLRRTIDTIGMPAYQRVGASNDYDTAGFYPYLAFDGTDDSMATAASVDFTGTNKMAVFAGVTKLSDAATGQLFELSTSAATNNGSFLATAPNGAAANYGFSSRGTSTASSNPTTYAAPISNVLTSTSDISAPSLVFRINGAQVGSSTFTQGTGNYGNYQLFLGARDNASRFFNGRIYPFFIRGAATDAGLIAQVEQYIRDRMPVSF